MSDSVYVTPDQLAVGMFVCLDLSWLQHPFSFSSFVIQNEDQIATLRGLGLTRVRIDPLRSKLVIARHDSAPVAPGVDTGGTGAASIAADKAARVSQNRALRDSIARAERKAEQAVRVVRQTARQFLADPAQAIVGTDALVAELAESLLGNSETMVHLLGDKVAGEELYFHSLNVAILAMILGKAIGLDGDTLRTVGVAAIFHDIGMEDIPSRVRLKTEALTHAEEALMRQHCEIGAAMAARGKLPAPVVAAILQHHENLDGSGYPRGLAGESIGIPARIINIVNRYDNLCNPLAIARAMTPYEALSTMFAKERQCFDPGMLGKMVRMLGVYPPGSIVRLSTGATAMVTSVNSARPLQPFVLVYDASIPRDEAIILDLEKAPEISISKAVRPASLAPSVIEYLSPRKRVTFYYGDTEPGS